MLKALRKCSLRGVAPRRSADSDALVVMRQVLTVDGDEGDWW